MFVKAGISLTEALETIGDETSDVALQRTIVDMVEDLRNGGTLSTAEAISVINSGMALAGHFGDGVLRAAGLERGCRARPGERVLCRRRHGTLAHAAAPDRV